jgi:dolichol kinase
VAVLVFRTTLYSHEPVVFHLLLASTVAVAGAVLELLSSRINDNVSVPVLTGALAMVVLG